MTPAPALDPALQAKFTLYNALLLKWQKAVNLVAPSTLAQAWERHFLDSLQMVDLLPATARVIVDMGSGAGFPGLVMAMARPDLDMHLIESDSKKGAFLLTVSRETGVQNVNLHIERIESVLPTLHADIVCARALAPLGTLLDMAQSQLTRADRPAVGLFLKGAGWQDEMRDARRRWRFDAFSTPSATLAKAAVLCISRVTPVEKA